MRCLLLKFSSQSSEQCSLSRQVPGFLQVKLLSLSVVTCSKVRRRISSSTNFPRVSPHHLILQLLQWHVQAHLFSSSVLTCLQVKRGRQLTKSAQNFVCTSDLRGERGAEGEQLSSRVGHIMSHLKSFNLDVRSLTELFVPALCLSVHRVG